MVKSFLLILVSFAVVLFPCECYGLKSPKAEVTGATQPKVIDRRFTNNNKLAPSKNPPRGGGRKKNNRRNLARKEETNLNPAGGGWSERYISNLFDSADTNNDGSISTSEVYTLVLKMYIKVNRRAPVQPPTRGKVEALFNVVDVDHNNRLDKKEFRKLMRMLYARTTTRVISFQIVKLIVAPFFAVSAAQSLANLQLIQDVAADLPEKLQSINLWTTVLTVLCVSQLGAIALSTADFFLDKIYLEDQDEEL